MASPALSTAILLNNLLIQINQLYTAEDIFFSQEEFALGKPLSVRNLDLCWGYNSVSASTSANSGKELIVGTGITRNESGGLDHKNAAQQGFMLTDLLSNSVIYEDVYVFGSIYLVAGNTIGDTPSIVSVLVGGDGGSGSPLCVSRTVKQSEALNWIFSGLIPAASAPVGTSLEIMKFMLDITQYQYNQISTNNVQALTVDVRRPRGWGGYPDEVMSTILTTNIIQRHNNFAITNAELQAYILNIVKAWMHLPGWTPSFIDYWNAHSSQMPAYLGEYLALNFGLIF